MQAYNQSINPCSRVRHAAFSSNHHFSFPQNVCLQPQLTILHCDNHDDHSDHDDCDDSRLLSFFGIFYDVDDDGKVDKVDYFDHGDCDDDDDEDGGDCDDDGGGDCDDKTQKILRLLHLSCFCSLLGEDK